MNRHAIKRIQRRSFEHLGLSSEMLRTLAEIGYHQPTEVQAGLMPLAMEDHDIVGQARTGTGKTAAFSIPIIERLQPPGQRRSVQALILVPTRELAVQVKREFQRLCGKQPFHSAAIYGGKAINIQIKALQRGVDVVIGTPGRVIDHLGRRTLSIQDVWCVVLDEADRMLDIGFRPDIERILRQCPTDRQTLLLSATVPDPILQIAKRYMHRPKLLNFSRRSLACDTIDQYYFTVEANRKFELLVRLLERDAPHQAIIFCRTRLGTQRLYRRLSTEANIDRVATIHGDMSQPDRDRAMDAFRQGPVRFLVATDVVGRGIDVTSISHIVNYDIPGDSEDYVHRVGRTGRMGNEGVAYTFVTPEQGDELTAIEQMINRLLERDTIEGVSYALDQAPRQASGEPKPAPPGGRRRRKHRRAL